MLCQNLPEWASDSENLHFLNFPDTLAMTLRLRQLFIKKLAPEFFWESTAVSSGPYQWWAVSSVIPSVCLAKPVAKSQISIL